MGALAFPALSSLPDLQSKIGTVLVHDPELEAGRRLARQAAGCLAIEGDRIRFAQALFARRPALVVGITRPADAHLIADVGREHGYVLSRPPRGGLRNLIADSGDRGAVLAWALAPGRRLPKL
ncbi:MAG: hypothetical protein ABIT09_13555 [Croceibacterium sp.]